MRYLSVAAVAGLLLSGTALAAPPVPSDEALELAKKAIALRSVRGPDNKTPEVAALFRDALVAGGMPAADIEITRVDDTAYLIGTWRGSDPKLKPLVISGHMDVVEAKPADWKRDPFTPVVENGYLFGRGATDMKLDGAIAIAALNDLRRAGYKPRRTIIIEFSGDEETVMKTSGLIADRLKNAELVINIDGGGGVLDETTGKPKYWTWQGAEKTYSDIRLTVTDPGGHSSAPRPRNAIVVLSRALDKIGAYRFKPEVSPLTREALTKAAQFEERQTGAAMKAFAANPADESAIAVLAANPATVGIIGTTCIPTLISGGHAENALPQRATANINCRIFPGHKPADIMAELAKVAGNPEIKFEDVTEGSVPSDASPMRPDFVAAITRAMGKVYPGVPIIPSQSSGASDSMYFRFHNVPSYGASPTFIKDSDSFSHGLNERTPISNIAPGIQYYRSVITDLSR
ncbi:MAG: M20/M25/M40 family metallo-hydrolase [Pseudomonadota bacterium]